MENPIIESAIRKKSISRPKVDGRAISTKIPWIGAPGAHGKALTKSIPHSKTAIVASRNEKKHKGDRTTR